MTLPPTVSSAGAGPEVDVGPDETTESEPPAGADAAPARSDSAAVPTVRPFRIESGTVVRRAPDGDTLAVVDEPGRVAIVGSEGEWARVLIEGWVRLPEGTAVPETGGGLPTGSRAAGDGLSLEDVVRDPAMAVGSLVTWELQFISLERAGQGRPEFAEGEAYMLTRPSGEGTGRFVYVVVPEAAVEEAGEFVPLERLEVRGRIRTGASAVTGGPVLDLVEMTRRR